MAELRDANTNPWYVLMTLYGEQEGKSPFVDEELHAKNRAVWNAWSCQGLDDAAAAEVAKLAQVDVGETRGWAEMAAKVKRRHRAETMKRNTDSDFTYPGFPDFEEFINCSGIQFFNKVVLKNCIFTRSATFTQAASFSSATFNQIADFYYATFTQGAYFNSATFTQHANFRSATFDGPAKFVGAKFGVRGADEVCVPIFTEAAFARLASFREAAFVTHYPVLEGTEFRETVALTAKDGYWPKPLPVLLNEADEDAKDVPTKEVAKESCAALRHALAKQGMPEEEHFFFRREMEFARQVEWADRDASWLRFKAWPYWLFKVFSGYGESIALPMRALGELFLLGAVALFGFFLPTLGWFKAIGLAASMSFSNLLPLFGFSRSILKDVLSNLPWGLQFLSGAQTILALPLLFFLALRKRFRLR